MILAWFAHLTGVSAQVHSDGDMPPPITTSFLLETCQTDKEECLGLIRQNLMLLDIANDYATQTGYPPLYCVPSDLDRDAKVDAVLVWITANRAQLEPLSMMESLSRAARSLWPCR